MWKLSLVVAIHSEAFIHMKSLRLFLVPILIGVLIVSLFIVNRKLDRQIAQLEKLVVTLADMTPKRGETEPSDLLGSAKLHSLADVEKQFAAIGVSTSATTLAKTIAEVDEWLIEPKFSTPVQKLLDIHLAELRQRVIDEVKNKHALALSAKTGADAARVFNEAGVLVALFPMGESSSIVDNARWLTSSHRNVGLKIEVAKRMRYNQWAVTRIEQALQGYHAQSRFLSPKKENAALIDSLVKYLGEVDPNQLEPSVLGIYNYVVEITKESISETDKMNLAKRLTAPEIRRSHSDDF